MSTRDHKQILIASNSFDEVTWQPVVTLLEERGYDVIVYEGDKVANGKIELEIYVTQKAGVSIRYGERLIDPANITAAWWRRPNMFDMLSDKALQLSLAEQRKRAQHPVWSNISERAWLNSPQRINIAEHKVDQLLIARTLGFTIPDTVITNRWEIVGNKLPAKIIFKPHSPMVYSKDGLRLTYTTPLDNDPKRLPISISAFPGIWQPYLPKRREWRITIVGNNVFDAAIYTDETARDDWRIHQGSSLVEFRHEVFPQKEKKLCFAYLRKFGLRFGAFDFIEAEDGRITFLECNPNGQYGWLESRLGFPISRAIADELVKISRTVGRKKLAPKTS